MKHFIFAAILLPILSTAAASATFLYDIQIDAITGDGEAGNIGFYSTGSVGDIGTGQANVSEAFPADYSMTLEATQFFAIFPGIATAVTQGPKTVVHDATAGTLTVSGFLGGLTGPYPGFLTSASTYEIVYSGATGGPLISSATALEAFLDGASMSGFVSAFFIPDSDPETGYFQTIAFSDTTPIPLPATGLLLLSAFGFAALARRKR